MAVEISQPDLIITGVTAPPSGVPGGKVTLSAIVKNSGSAYSSYSYTYFYLSRDVVIDSLDSYVGRGYVSSLSPGSSKTVYYSGLILAFERPLAIGDVVQLGELQGEVRSIGIRASVIRTFDGADVIVPNGQLISNELINWTRSDRTRRLEIPVGVAYGTDPATGISLLTDVAQGHDRVRTHPKPLCLFQGFGESSLDFVLGIWTDQYGGRLVYTTVMSAAVATWMLSWAYSYETFLLAALGVGIAGGSFAVGIAYVPRWYPREKQGTALGIFGALAEMSKKDPVLAVIFHEFIAHLLSERLAAATRTLKASVIR